VTVTVAGNTAQGPLFIYNAINQLTASNGAVTTYNSGDFGNAWLLYSSAGPGCSTCSVRGNVLNSYDGNGNLLSTTDANGNTITYTYDGNNNMLSQTAQLNGSPVTTSYTYNNLAEVLSMTDPLGNTTTDTYDANGNLLTVSSPAPNGQTPPSVTQFTYNTLGELTQILDPLNHPATISYYPTGLIQSITDAQNHTTSYTYDSRGNRTGVIDPINGSSHPTSFAYDAMSRLTGITYPDGTTASFAYDSRGRRISATDQNGKTTTYAYDAADRLISATDPASNLTQYGYDTEDNLISITDANNHTTYFAYDTMGRVTQTTFPSTLTESYTYDQLYNLTSKTDRKGQTIQYVYDSLYRMISKTYPDETSASYVYDLVGKIQQASDPTGTYAFAYDNMGRLIGTSTQYTSLPGYNFQNSYGYDAASNRTSLTAPDGSTNSYSYDTLNRMTTLTNSLTGQFGFGYDALSRRTQLTRPNGVNTSYSYDSASHLLSVLHQAGSTTLDGASYTYDYAGNRTSKTNDLNGTTWNYDYDATYELLQVTHNGSTKESFSYDAVGNRLSSSAVPSYSYNPSNELTSNSSGSYTYDANGNTLSDPSGKSYTWDFENRLTQAVVPGTNGGTTAFKYDPFGRRIQKSGPLGTTNYLYDGINLIEEVDNSGNILARYTHGAVIDEDLSMLRSGTISYYHADALGSITSLSNPAGALANTYIYDTFGNLATSTGSVTNPFQYTGREFDSETGLYYYRARYYNVQLGRFISEDPTGFAGGPNFYAYAKNRPTNFIDPTGLFTIRNGIKEHDTLNIDSVCGPGTGGACTSATALLMCTCTKDECSDTWKAHAELRLYGDMYIYNGPWSTFPRRPKDRSVVDANSARNHENNVHINPAIAAVTPLINALEGQSFNSEADCKADCDKTGTAVTNLFRQTLRSTQQQENNK
jgi:RHS repeat-associated protein